MSASVAGRTPTSTGRSSGQQGGDASVPMTTSAACGRPVQQAALMDTMLEVPTLSTTTKPTLRSSWQWCEHVLWLMPRTSARSPMRRAPEGDVDSVCRRRTRVGSARTANHSAYPSASALVRPAVVRPGSVDVDVMSADYLALIDCHRYSPFIDARRSNVREDLMPHPVVIIGAGPIGLAAAAHAVERGLDVVVLEAGSEAGSAVGQWAHVRLFSSWAELVDPAARRLLDAAGTWTAPDDVAYPTGGEWREHYLRPLAELLDASPLARRPVRRPRHRRRARGPRPARRLRSRRRPLRRARAGRPRTAKSARQCRDRRLRHVDHPQSARRRRLPRPR